MHTKETGNWPSMLGWADSMELAEAGAVLPLALGLCHLGGVGDLLRTPYLEGPSSPEIRHADGQLSLTFKVQICFMALRGSVGHDLSAAAGSAVEHPRLFCWRVIFITGRTGSLDTFSRD
jgi:hypothetical protein